MSGRALAWIVGDDTGVSSKAIWSHMMGAPVERDPFGGHPHDPDDFGRCYRLLKLMPEWRGRIGEMARYPYRHGGGWPELVAHWDELEAMWERVGYGGPHEGWSTWDKAAAKAMYDRMQEIMGRKDSPGLHIEFAAATDRLRRIADRLERKGKAPDAEPGGGR